MIPISFFNPPPKTKNILTGDNAKELNVLLTALNQDVDSVKSVVSGFNDKFLPKSRIGRVLEFSAVGAYKYVPQSNNVIIALQGGNGGGGGGYERSGRNPTDGENGGATSFGSYATSLGGRGGYRSTHDVWYKSTKEHPFARGGYMALPPRSAVELSSGCSSLLGLLGAPSNPNTVLDSGCGARFKVYSENVVHGGNGGVAGVAIVHCFFDSLRELSLFVGAGGRGGESSRDDLMKSQAQKGSDGFIRILELN